MSEQRHADRGAVGQECQRIAVGAARERGAGRGNAAGAGHVLDEEVLPELLAQGLRDKPRRDVGDAAGAERQDHAHRMIRIFGLGACRGRGKAGGNQCQRKIAAR
jgi:hypothetical protein